MSNLLPQASINAPEGTISSARPVFFEDSFESSDMGIYELLNLSSLRQKDDLQDRVAYRELLLNFLSSDITVVEPMAFSWDVNNQSFESTSLLFELYMSTLSLGEELLRTECNYKDAVSMFKHGNEILQQWKTADLVFPSCPHVCTKEYLQSMISLCKSSLLLKEMRKGKNGGMALSSAMSFAGDIPYHLGEWSDTALNHYLASRALLYFAESQKNKEAMEQGDMANQSYTAAKEALAVCQLVDRSKCHMNESLDNDLNEILSEAPEHMESLRQVFYAVEVPLDTIQLPASLNNDSKQAGEN